MSVQKQDHPSVKVAVCGISGAGKTTLWEKLIRRESAKWLFLFDHKAGDLARRFGVAPCSDLAEMARATMRGGVVIFDPSRDFPGEPEKGFEIWCEAVWEIGTELRGKKIIGTDELDSLVDARSEPEALCKILDQGRTFQMDCYFIAHAMNGVHNQVRKQITEIFAMAQGDDLSAQWLVNRGFPKSELETLKNGEWLYHNKNTGQRARGGKSFVPKNAGRNLRGL